MYRENGGPSRTLTGWSKAEREHEARLFSWMTVSHREGNLEGLQNTRWGLSNRVIVSQIVRRRGAVCTAVKALHAVG